MQEDTAEYGAKDDADAQGMQRVVDELMDKVLNCLLAFNIVYCCSPVKTACTFSVHLLEFIYVMRTVFAVREFIQPTAAAAAAAGVYISQQNGNPLCVFLCLLVCVFSPAVWRWR